jgi:F0F1-type ATP synthase assembly protein I
MRQPEYDRDKVGAYLGLGAGFAGSTLFFAALGWLLDREIGTTPAFTLLGTFLGAAAGFYSLYRRAMALQERESPKSQESPKNQSRDGNSEPSGKAPDRE